MTEHVRVNGLGALRRHLVRGQRGIKDAVGKAIWSTARKAVVPIRKRTPRAFGELQESIQAYSRGQNGNPVTIADAPHAGAVEIGSPPHKPNFERLLAWVRLRGMQGLNRNRTPQGSKRMRFGHGAGPTTAKQAKRIAGMFKAKEVRGRWFGTKAKGNRLNVGRHSPVDAAVQIAQAISNKIEKYGTKPHWYVRDSLSDIQQILNGEMRKQLGRAASNTNPAMRVKDSELL